MSESNFNADDPNPDDLDEQSSRPDGVDGNEADDFDPAALPPYLNEGPEPEPELDPSPETGDEGTPAPSPEPSAETPQPPVVESNGTRYAQAPDGGVTNIGPKSQVFGRSTGDTPVETASSLPPVSNVFSNADDAPAMPQIQQEVPQPTADASRPADNPNPGNINFSSFPKEGDVPKDLAAEVQSLQPSTPPQAKLLGGDQSQQSGEIAKIESAVQELTATVARLTEALSDIEMV